MTGQNPQPLTPAVILGAVLMMIGAVLIFDKLNIAALHQVVRFWPVLLLGGGVALLLEHFDGPPRRS